MKYTKLPAPVLAKLLTLEEAEDALTERIAKTQDGIAAARTRLTGAFAKDDAYRDVRATLDQLIADKPRLEQKLHAAQSVLSNCKDWLERLPSNTVLELVEVKANGHDLKEVRAQLEVAKVELASLRAMPTSSADLERRIRDYVLAMARPTISGIGKGEKLKIVWPGAGWGSSGPREDRADVLPMMALLFPDQMISALLREVERTANHVVPIADRQQRIAELYSVIEHQGYIEETLVTAAIAAGEDAQRHPSASPLAVLGVKIAEEAERAERVDRTKGREQVAV
jgi:hypothetical protein